ncbi:MAG: hypothetical protein AAFX04_01630 [Pseudomonadota bacterium]
MMIRLFLLSLVLPLLAVPAEAAWRKASSEHFVVYSDQSEGDIRDFAENLEKYHSAMAYITQKGEGPVSPSNRVTIFVLRNQRALRGLYGNRSSFVAGFYSSRAGASVAFVTRVEDGVGTELSFSETVMLHEYAHHFMYSYYGYTFPLWYQEGFAEFYASAGFDFDGSVRIGRPNNHRADELFDIRPVPVEMLLDTAAYKKARKEQGRYDSFYVRSWLLFHYLTMDNFSPRPERKGQLLRYLQNLGRGMKPIEAATKAFGPLDALEKDLRKYARRRPMRIFDVPAKDIKIGEITVQTLSEGAGEVMPLLMRSRRGVDAEQATALLPQVREVAAKYPDDPFVNAALAEAEYDAGNDAEAVAAADRTLAVEPGNMDAHRQKIFATFRLAEAADGEAEKPAWKTALRAISAANALEPDNPIPLMHYYRSYSARGMPAPELAKQALEQALGLAPYDKGLRMNVANQQIFDGRYSYARFTLQPLLLDPHNSGFSSLAQEMLTKIEGKQDRDKSNADN